MANSKIRILYSLEDFKEILRNSTGSMIHCSVQRRCCISHKHHYIALSDTFCKDCNTCDVIQLTKEDCRCGGRVKRVRRDIQIDIVKGLYVYQNNGYPRNNDDCSVAYGRFQRLQSARRGYSVSLNNCEHIVNYILTGHAIAHQPGRLSVFRGFLLEFIDLFTGGFGENLSVAVFNGFATSMFMLGFSYYHYVQIKVILDKESKSLGMFGKFKRSVVSWIGSIFKNSVNEISPDEQSFLHTLVFLLVLDPEKVIGSTNAKALLQKAAPWLRSFTTAATGIFTFIFQGLSAYFTVRSLRRDLHDKTIKSADFERERKNAFLFMFSVTLLSMLTAFLFFNGQKRSFHPISVFLHGFFGNFASRFFVQCTMDVCSRF